MPKKNFVRDLNIGSVGEDIVSNIFKQHGIDVVLNKNKDVKHDILVKYNKDFRIEVKYDLYSAKSGNVAIEFYNPKTGNNSGVAITEAELWAHIINNGESVWLTSVKKLKNFMGKTQGRIIPTAGDGNAALCLYKIEDIMPVIFYEIKNISKEELLVILEILLNE